MTMVLARVRRTIQGRRLLRRGDHVLVACSGGPDSVVLTDVLARLSRELGITLVVASVDHGLRSEAARDVERVGELARSLELPFRPLRVEVGSGPSVQAHARTARYDALLQLARAEGAQRVAVGHTLDDQAETVLARMMRGAGVEGLGGIAPGRRDGVIRPLIDCRRAEIQQHLAHRGLTPVLDPTNADPRFERARIRANLLPALQAEDPAMAEHLADLADEARAMARLRRRCALRLLRRARTQEGHLRLAPLRASAPVVRRGALRQWVERQTARTPGRAQIEALDAAVDGRGEVLLADGWKIHAACGLLRVERARAHQTRSARDFCNLSGRPAVPED